MSTPQIHNSDKSLLTDGGAHTQSKQFFGHINVDPVYFEFENNQLMESK